MSGRTLAPKTLDRDDVQPDGCAAMDEPAKPRHSIPRQDAYYYDRDAILARIFELPLPPMMGHRTYPIDEPLGRLMRLKQLMVRDVAKWPGTPGERILTEILAGRRPVGDYRYALAEGLGVDARLL